MYVVFLLPLVLSIVAAVLFALGDYGLFTKVFFGALAVIAVALQFVPAWREGVHFLVPLFLQLFVCGSWYVASQLE